jgi:uncharacterized membrane protein YeaQ/YmgE (transglycosylase-associated protein family)
MGIIAWIILGAIAGIIAENLAGYRTGIFKATIIGILGALLGGFLAQQLFHIKTVDTFFNLSTWVTAIVGAVLLVVVIGAASGGRGRWRGRRGRRA